MRCTGYEMARYKGTQASHLYDKSMHTLCTIQWATAPGQSLNYPRLKSITHLRTFSDNGVYVALQLFLVILVSTGALGSFTCSGMTLPIYMGPKALRGIRANVESQVFTPYKFGSTAGDRTPDLLTTRPTCYHSATALCEDKISQL